MRMHSPRSWPSMPAPRARPGTNVFRQWSVAILAETAISSDATAVVAVSNPMNQTGVVRHTQFTRGIMWPGMVTLSVLALSACHERAKDQQVDRDAAVK